MLAELGAVEQRYRAVLEVLDEGVAVTGVARRYGVVRQTVHTWLRRYAEDGLGGLADRSPRPASCPHQMPAAVEARIVGMRREHPGWGPSRIRFELERAGVAPLPGRSAVYRALVRHGLVAACKRRRRREDYRRQGAAAGSPMRWARPMPGSRSRSWRLAGWWTSCTPGWSSPPTRSGSASARPTGYRGPGWHAGTDYQAGRGWARQSIDVSIVAGSVQLSRDGKIIRVHPVRHDRARELGAFANPKGRPRRKNSAIGNVV